MKETIQAIYPSEVKSFFDSLNLLDDLESGRILCNFSDDVITADNFGAATRQNGRLVFACNKESCLAAIAAPTE